MGKRLDFVVFGATGFTGKYAVDIIHRVLQSDKALTWGIAGRSQFKLEQVLKDLQKKTGDDALSSIKIIIADVRDEDSVKEMTKQAKVIINCCGPYRFYGESVIKACIETKTNQVDISAELTFVENMQLLYNEAAKKAGVYIVSSCGLFSVPADLGVIYLQDNFKGKVNSVESFMKIQISPGFPQRGFPSVHYGTWESLVVGMSTHKELASLRRQLYPEPLPKMLPKLQKRSVIHKNDIDDAWYISFLAADESIVYRTQRYLYETEQKRPAQFNTYVGFSFFGAVITYVTAVLIFMMSTWDYGRKLLLDYPKVFSLGLVSHEGPTEELINNTNFSFVIRGEGWNEKVTNVDGKPTNKSMKVKVSGVDPVYRATCTTLVISAICMIKDAVNLPKNGGVYTPGAAFAKTSIIDKLKKNNIKFEIIE